MIALIDTTDKTPGFLRGLTGGVILRRAEVLRAPSAYIALTETQNTGAADRQIRSAARALRRAGISTVCFAEGFPYSDDFESCGFSAAGATELYNAVSDKAADYLARPGSAVYLYAPWPGDMVMRTLAVLCRICRLVMADIPGGAGACDAAYDALRRSLGVSIVSSPPARLLQEAELAFIFGVPRTNIALPESCVVYSPEPDALDVVGAQSYVSELDVVLPEDKERLLPSRFPREPLIAEAMRSLTLGRDAPKLHSVTISRI